MISTNCNFEKTSLKFDHSDLASEASNPHETVLWALTPTATGLKLLEAPASVQETHRREYLENANWKKTDAIWARRNHAGKRLVMYMIGCVFALFISPTIFF